VHVQTCFATWVSHETSTLLTAIRLANVLGSFILKTKEQRAAEKALMDKSPLKTLTLEDFLESERHKLTGTLTPVTPETFAKWKKDRLDKKAAEEQARNAKENTGRAMFESGKWQDEDESEDDDDDIWNLEKMRRETEAIRLRKEEDRMLAANGAEASLPDVTPATEPEPEPEAEPAAA
jgi:hypothetical protein